MASTLTIAELKASAVEFVNRLGNEHDTTSATIIGLLDEEFAVQHGELSPSTGGRDAFLTGLGERLKLSQRKVSVEVKHVIAELYDDGAKDIEHKTGRALGLIHTAQLDMITFNSEGKIVFCQDLHSPKE
ncbi:hypothetical protein N7510_007973 [Penicillium lagena]|uniref:uncharacterized protein n=1 Tax=Penicillium lagena TaxID=94218 RepID=UPI0025412946|nr:uncharacterized protein N7510_007973 [Penicillium lagena]KAJ5611254.1 hypothetical protein N7510_007973 [Penicillium lagena]